MRRVLNSLSGSGWHPGLLGSLAIGGLVICLLAPGARAQISASARSKNFVAPVTDAQGKKSVIRGADARPAGKGVFELTSVKAETFRGQEKDLMAEAPKCLFASKSNVAWSDGSLSIRTADGRLAIDGEGFRWQLGDSRLNSKLVLSNRVHALIRKRLINPKLGGTAAPRSADTKGTNAPAAPSGPGMTNETIEVTANTFEYSADSAVFRGNVRAHEAEGDLACEVLTVVLKADSGSVDRIEAEHEVVLDQAGTRATADKAVYSGGQDNEFVEMTGHATWIDHQRRGGGERVTYDRRQRVLKSEQKAYLRLPRSSLGPEGFFGTTPKASPQPTMVDTNAFVDVLADSMTIQLPSTSNTVQRIIAEKNVMIMDSTQGGRAMSDQAIYDEATGKLELTGSPMLESDGTLITGKTLTIDRTTRLLTAAPDAYLKLPIHALGRAGVLNRSAPGLSTNVVAATNQFLEVWASQFEYRTNLLRFIKQVRANFLEGAVARGKLTCSSEMRVLYGDRLQQLTAEQDVELEQFVNPEDPRHVARHAHCQWLQVDFSTAGRPQSAAAEGGITVDQEEVEPKQPQPLLSKLTADSVHAFFSTVTNRLDRLVAETNVVFSREQRVVRGAKAVYTDSNGWLELSGHPTATMPEGRIVQADRLIYDRLRQRFLGKGQLKTEWKRPPERRKSATGPTAQD